MVKRSVFGWMFPVSAAAVVLGAAKAAGPSTEVFDGIALGLLLAVLQAYFSTASLWLSRNKIFLMMSLFVGGILFRLVFLTYVAWRIKDMPGISFTATLMTMVLATTAFLVVEAETALKG